MHAKLKPGIGTLVNQHGDEPHPLGAHVTPIFQTTSFGFEDLASLIAVFSGETAGYSYTRVSNPNAVHLETLYARLEGLDLPEEQAVACRVFASGMAAISAAILASLAPGETVLAQRALYGGTFGVFEEIAPRSGINVVYVSDGSADGWQRAMEQHPRCRLIYAETPANPSMEIIDLQMLAALAHANQAWLMVDNTFASPFCQRPLTLGADVVLHSTTKYLTGHGVVVGGAVISPHLDFIEGKLQSYRKLLGGSASPFDCWLAALGLRTFELRMQRHCENALKLADFLQAHPRVTAVNFPGLPDHPGHALAGRQMLNFGGMLSFEVQGGAAGAERLLNSVKLPTMAASLGSVDSLIQYPAAMSHAHVPPAIRRQMGVSDGLIRISVGIENIEDILSDLQSALETV